ncbi:Sperm-tail PG-rich repeat-containing protein 2 [Paramecium bursaria]
MSIQLIDLKISLSVVSFTSSFVIVIFFIINKELRTPAFRLVLQLQLADALYCLASIINSENNNHSLWQGYKLIIDYQLISRVFAELCKNVEYSLDITICFQFICYNCKEPITPKIIILLYCSCWYCNYKQACPLIVSLLDFIPNIYGLNIGYCWIDQSRIAYILVNYSTLLIIVIIINFFLYYNTFVFLKNVTDQQQYKLFVYPIILIVGQVCTLINSFRYGENLKKFDTLDYLSIIFSSLQGLLNTIVFGLTPQVTQLIKDLFTRQQSGKVIDEDQLRDTQFSAISLQQQQMQQDTTSQRTSVCFSEISFDEISSTSKQE